jgi:hypothetical protein
MYRTVSWAQVAMATPLHGKAGAVLGQCCRLQLALVVEAVDRTLTMAAALIPPSLAPVWSRRG